MNLGGRDEAGPIEFNGQPAVALRAADGASAIVLLHGAQVVSWRPAGGEERLFLSERSRYGDDAAVRGGIPVIFPQFSTRGALPRHGFVRTRKWRLAQAEVGQGDALAVLELADDGQTRAAWPHPFALELTICVRADRLDVELAVTNTGSSAFAFMAALHTYLRVEHIEAARLAGLRDRRYEDARSGATEVDEAAELRIDGEVDRIYFDVGSPLHLADGRQRTRIEAERLPDVVVWNPWDEKSASMADLARSDFRRFLCVEAALIGHPITLAPGAEWSGRQSLIAG